MFLYKWEEIGEYESLDKDETITDYTFISEENFLLFVLLTSKGDLRIYYDIPGTGPHHRSVSIRDIAPIWCHAAALCLIPDASGLALILTNGNVLLIPLRLLIDIPWGHGGVLHNDSFTLIEVEVKNQLCLKLPTSAICYLSLYSKKPILIYSNKAGQIFVIDLVIRKVSVGLGAPQSIHDIETLITANSIYLLVTGFTGAQWLLPLEENGLSLRETLSRIIPSELKQVPKITAKLSVTQDSKLCLLEMEQNRLQLYDDVSFQNPLVDINVPKNSWMAHWTDNAIFVICDQTTVLTSVHCGQHSSFVDLVYESFEKPLLASAILGVIPAARIGLFPSCIIVTEKGAVFIRPHGSFEDRLVKIVSQRHFLLDFCTKLATRLNCSHLEFCTKLIRHSLSCVVHSKLPSDHFGEITNLATSIPELEINVAVRIFMEFGVAELLLPAVLGRCDENAQDPCRHSVIKLFIAKFKKFPNEKMLVENDLRKFLLKHVDVSEGLEELLTCGFWSCVSLVVKRDERNSTCIAKFLAESKADWPTSCISDFVRILSSLSWLQITSHAEALLRRMVTFLPNLKSATHIFLFLKVAEQQMQSNVSSATVLFVLASLRLLAVSSSVDRKLLLSSTPLSCGSNCLSVVSENESPVYWGEFTAGARKAKNDEKSRSSSFSSIAQPRNIEMSHRVCSVSCGTEHLLILTFQGEVYSFGKNRYGQCGVGHRDELNEPALIKTKFEGVHCLKAGHYHSALVDSVGKVFTWGWGMHGQLGHCGIDRTDDVLFPKLVETINEPVIAVACGYAHSVFLTKSGNVLTCGNGNYGQLGSGQTEKKRFVPGLVIIPEPVKLIASKYFNCLALTKSQKLYQWGTSPQALKMKIFLQKRLRSSKGNTASPSNSALSDKSLESSKSHLFVCQTEHTIQENIVCLDTGTSHSALVTESGSLYTWGKGLEMQLGHGNKKEQEEPHQIFEPSSVWKFVSCGLDFTAALTSDGSVFVWGRNDKGHLGVTSAPSSGQTRKLVLKTQKGPKTVQFSAGSCVPIPQKLSSVVSSFASEIAFSEVSIKRLIDLLRKLDVVTLREIATCLLVEPVDSLAAVFVLLLAGDTKSAVKLFVKLASSNEEAVLMFENDVKTGSDFEDDSVYNLMWEFITRCPNFATQWELLNLFLARFSMPGRLLNNAKLSLQAPSVIAGDSTMLDGLDAMEKLRLIERWRPNPRTEFVDVPQNGLQKIGSKVRVWTCCGEAENCLSSRLFVTEKRRICPKCSDAWKDEVRLKFPKK